MVGELVLGKLDWANLIIDPFSFSEFHQSNNQVILLTLSLFFRLKHKFTHIVIYGVTKITDSPLRIIHYGRLKSLFL